MCTTVAAIAVSLVVSLASGAVSAVTLRREVRAWTQSELWRLREALQVMSNTSLQAGRAAYGPAFQPHAHLSMLHAVAVLDPRGDQGHSNWSPDQPQACFFTFHNALLAMIEASVRAIDSRIEAIPYWEATLDTPGGPYYRTNRSIYTIIGSPTGDPSRGYEVQDGLLPGLRVPAYPELNDSEVPGSARRVFPRPAEGWVRNHRLAAGTDTWVVQRFPANKTLNAIITIGPNTSTSMSHFPKHQPQQDDLVMSPEMILRCRGTRRLAAARLREGQLNVNSYLSCMDFGTFKAVSNRSCPPGEMANNRSALQWQRADCAQLWMHSQGHFKIGGQSVYGLTPSESRSWQSSWVYDSDLIDLATSPNDLLVFILWHAGIMRQFLRWQQLALRIDPSISRSYYGFPANAQVYPQGNKGCFLDDVLNSAMPFNRQGVFPTAPTGFGYTHRELMRWSSPGEEQLWEYDDHEDRAVWHAAAEIVDQRQHSS